MSCEVPGLSASANRRVLALNEHVVEASERYGVDPVLIHATVWVESKHVPTAVSSKGALGPMQVMPETSKTIARAEGLVNAPMDPRLGILIGTAFLSRLLKRYGGDTSLATAAYYAGPGRVPIPGPVPAIAADYVRAVHAAMPKFSQLDASCSGPMAPSPRRRPKRADPVVPQYPTPALHPTAPRQGSGGGVGGLLLVAAVMAFARGVRSQPRRAAA